jgi:hypothetical protein
MRQVIIVFPFCVFAHHPSHGDPDFRLALLFELDSLVINSLQVLEHFIP